MPYKKAIWTLLMIAILASPVLGSARSLAGTSQATPATDVVVRVYYRDQANLDAVAGQLDIWENHPDGRYVVALVSPQRYAWLEGLGYSLEIDAQKTERLGVQAALDPRFAYFDPYLQNPNGKYIVEFMQDINAAYPDLTELLDVGDAWLAGNGGYARDMWVLRVTNEDPAYGDIAAKPVFFMMATIHAREVATPELAMRYIQYLTTGYKGEGGYGADADSTWLVNHNVLYVLVVQNPDGLVVNEQDTAEYWRKNLDSNDGCTDPTLWGVDLNRNHSFLWGCCGGSSAQPCSETYRGPSRASEPETQAFQTFFASVVPDQNGPNGDDEVPPAAPDDTTGVFISLHSYADEILWPWYLPGYPPAPNQAQMERIGRKFAFYNGFTPSGSIGYTVDGSTDYWTYGKFGIPSYTFEVGSGGDCGDFFPQYGCIDGIDGMPRNFWAEQKPAFLYASKIAKAPYLISLGPDAADVAAVPAGITPGEPVQIQATVADHRYSNDPLQPIGGAEYFVNAPGEDGTGIPMSPVDGAWGGMSEQVVAGLDTAGLGSGQHYILVHGQNSSGDWGPFTAAFLYVLDPGVSPVIQGFVRDGSTNAPVAATVKAGIFQTTTDPATGFYSILLVPGTYDMTAEAAGYVVSTVLDVPAQDYQTVPQDFYMFQYCDVFADDVESGNLGWTADPPWAITDEASHSATHSWTDSPGANYGNNVNVKLTSPAFDFSNTTGVSLSFWHIYDLQDGFDKAYVEYSTDGGVSWLLAATYNGEQHLTWTQETLPLPALDNQSDVRIRFRLQTNAYVTADGWHIDDIAISAGGPGCAVPASPAAAFSASGPAHAGEPVSFLNQTLGTPPLTYAWDMGDGLGASTEVNPVYTYQTWGSFTVTLTATNALGSGAVSHPVVVLPKATVFLPVVIKQP